MSPSALMMELGLREELRVRDVEVARLRAQLAHYEAVVADLKEEQAVLVENAVLLGEAGVTLRSKWPGSVEHSFLVLTVEIPLGPRRRDPDYLRREREEYSRLVDLADRNTSITIRRRR